ncbi:MAG: MATE family efflux transporter, partial [Ruminococcus sp.]
MSIISVLAATIGMLVDGIVIGQFLGQKCVSSFGLSSPVLILVAALAGIFSNGGASCCSNHIGRGESEKVKLNFTVTCVATVIVGIVVTVIGVFGCDLVAVLLGAKGELIKPTSDYIKGIGLGGVAILLSQVIMIYVRTDNDSSLGFISVLFMTASNIAMDIVFATVLKWGMFGMGLATSISYLVCLVVCLLHFRRKDNLLKFTKITGGLGEFWDVFKTGIPSALNRGCMTVRGIILNRLLMALAGSIAVSALAVQNNVNNILSSMTMGVGMTVMLMAGIFYGERDELAIEKTLKISLGTGIILSTVVSTLVIIFAEPVVGLFLNSGGEGSALAVRCLRMFCLSLPFSMVCVVMINFYQCTRNLFMANVICICHGLLFVVVYSLALSPVLSTDAVWISFLFAEVTTIVLWLVVVFIRNKKRLKGFGDIMLLPENFEPDSSRTLNISVKDDMKQAMELSEKVSKFCEKFIDDENKINRLSLSI